MSRLRLMLMAFIGSIVLVQSLSPAAAAPREIYPTTLCGPIDTRARVLLLKSSVSERAPVQLSPANPQADQALKGRQSLGGTTLGCASGYLRPLLDGQLILDAYEIRFDFDLKSGFGVGNL